jgi:hypothetical protein
MIAERCAALMLGQVQPGVSEAQPVGAQA